MMQSALEPAGPQAQRIAELTTLLIVVVTLVFIVTMAFLAFSLWRGRTREVSAGEEVNPRLTRWVVGSVAVTTLIVIGLLFANFATGRALAGFAGDDALSIRVNGHQWWWEVEYEDPVPARRALTANEIVIPVGRKIRLVTESRDVIHSLWAPQLHGKLDLIPGYRGSTYIQADEAGVFEGRCAEFCGLQHAKMLLRIIAVPPDSFAAWYEEQLKPAAPPADSAQMHGQEVFLTHACASCHTIRGTTAGSRVGPDLTHLASRGTIAAGSLPNTRGHLAGWITDPQRIKPGVRMPPNQLEASELHALLAYLEHLK